jgi:cell division protein ZapA
METRHHIRILGRELPVRSTASADDVRSVEEFVTSRIADAQVSSPRADALSVAILTLLNVAEEYLASCRREEERASRDGERVAAMVRTLEQLP